MIAAGEAIWSGLGPQGRCSPQAYCLAYRNHGKSWIVLWLPASGTNPKVAAMPLILLLIIIVLLLGGGGYGYSSGGLGVGGFGGIGGLIVVILIVYFLFGRGGRGI